MQSRTIKIITTFNEHDVDLFISVDINDKYIIDGIRVNGLEHDVDFMLMFNEFNDFVELAWNEYIDRELWETE